jgi:serine protease Do
MKHLIWPALIMAIGVALVTTTPAVERSAAGSTPALTAPAFGKEQPQERDSKLASGFSAVVKKVAPSVVNIYSTRTVRYTSGMEQMPFFGDPFFRRFFGERFDPRGQARPRTHRQQGLGSGVIVTEDGYILTNNHVVDGADEVKVWLEESRKEYDAKIVGRDPKTDIAVVKIEAKDLAHATLGDSDRIEVGDVVLALGNPFGIGQTVTMGIVSATGRGGIGIEDYEDFIQTDASINPGNSGGALVDGEGRVIGINTAILSRTGGNQGVGFAVPINLARHVMDELVRNGKVVRGYLGLSIQDLTPELARQFNAPSAGGALVGGVAEESAAAQAGIKSGDLITEFDGRPVPDSRNLKLMVGRMAPGSKVRLKVIRDGKERILSVTLKEMPEEKFAAAERRPAAESNGALDDVEVGDLTPAVRSRLALPDTLKGALITAIDPASAAYKAGLREGDVIQEINRQAVTDADEAVRAGDRVKTKSLLLRVWSRGGSRYVVVNQSKDS